MTSRDQSPPEFRWVPLEGEWESTVEDGMCYTGGEFDPPPSQMAAPPSDGPDAAPEKYVAVGKVLFNKHFKEGRIKARFSFSEVDHRSKAAIMLQYDPVTQDMLTFSVGGGSLRYSPGVTGYFFMLERWGAPSMNEGLQGTRSATPSKVWTPLLRVGFGKNLKAGRTYELEAIVRGASISLYVDGVEIGRHELDRPSLPGHPCGLFCMTHGTLSVTDILVTTTTPRAFVVMQFEPPEYEALFKDVIEPTCVASGFEPYRASSTYMPGLVIEDIKRQIAESRVVIAEITPGNPNVYYEVGYADALGKPLILIADRKDGLKPFDVRAYRTIFYENTIGGKNKIENDLRAYLKGIMDA